jgi:hypothetical protein
MDETNLLSLIRPWLDNIYQIITKSATAPFYQIFVTKPALTQPHASGDLAPDDHWASLHGARLTWPHGSAPAPTAPLPACARYWEEREMGVSGHRIGGSSALGKKTSDGGSLAGSPDLQRCGYTNHAVQRQQQAAGSSSTHIRFQLFLISSSTFTVGDIS